MGWVGGFLGGLGEGGWVGGGGGGLCVCVCNTCINTVYNNDIPCSAMSLGALGHGQYAGKPVYTLRPRSGHMPHRSGAGASCG